MKRTVLTLLLLSVFIPFSCGPQETDNDKNEQTEQTTQTSEKLDNKLIASMESLTVPNNGSIPLVWSAGDQIAVYTDVGVKTYTLSSGEGTAIGTFEGNLDGVKSLLGTAIAPVSYAVDMTTIKLPDSYTIPESGCVMPPLVATDAKAGGRSVFRHVLGMMRITPEDVPSSSDGIRITANRRISGNFTLNDGEIKSEDAVEGKITLRFSAGKAPEAICFPLPVGQYTVSWCFLSGNSEIDGTEKKSEEGITVARHAVSDFVPYKDKNPYGTGTREDPITIASSQRWNEAAAAAGSDATGALNECWYIVTDDLDFSGGNLVPFGADESHPFKGHIDGQNHKVSGLSVKRIDGSPACLFVFCNGAEIKNTDFSDVYLWTSGGYCSVIGYGVDTSVENCHVTGNIISVGNVSNYSYTAGIMGRAQGGSIKDCSVKANISAVSNHSGGIAGTVSNLHVENCSAEKGTTVCGAYYVGGIVAHGSGEGMLLRNCRSEATVNAGTKQAGGIISYITGGKIEGCVFSGAGLVSSRGENVGGIVGYTNPSSEVVIDRCASYGSMGGQYNVGGLVGQMATGSSKVTITNSAAIGVEVRSNGFNNYNYALAGGLVAWCTGNGSGRIINCVSRPACVEGTVVANGGLGGLLGYQSTKDCSVENCYSSAVASDILYRNASVTASSLSYYGSIVGRNSAASSYDHIRYDKSFALSAATNYATCTDCVGIDREAFTSGVLLSDMNANRSEYDSWKADGDKYPVPEYIPSDPSPKDKTTKRISIIGDSISTFYGWILPSYSAHYPNSNNCDVSSVDQTWWHILTYKYLKNARIDMNNSFGNTTVTQCLDETKKDQYWFNYDFCSRFIQCAGVGRPDIILIHGGTNDYGHNTGEELAKGYAMRGETVPSEDVFSSIFAAADAATTISASEALPYDTFCAAYTKLLQMIKVRYPEAKVVCVIGDYISVGMEKSILKIAAHYGAKAVDFLAVNGFNDQFNMSKYSGCHPDARGMKYMADKIYNEVGSWLDE